MDIQQEVVEKIVKLRTQLNEIEFRLNTKSKDSYSWKYWNRKLDRAIKDLEVGKVILD